MNMRTITAALTVFVLLAATQAQSQTIELGLVRWTAGIAEAESVDGQPRTYRLFQQVPHLIAVLRFSNESGTPILIDASALQSSAEVRLMTTMVGVPVDGTWDAEFCQQGDTFASPFASGSLVRLEARRAFTWRFTVRRDDREAFGPGNYDLEISLGDARQFVRAVDGTRWNGRALRSTTLHVAVVLPTTPDARLAMFRARAVAAMTENQPAEAVLAYQNGLEISPNDVSLLAGLGNASMLLNRYAEAIPALERALPAFIGAHSELPNLLTIAYISLGDEANAIRVLRRAGTSENRMPAQLKFLRDAATRRRTR
jgi:hypothetical protein